LALEVNDQYAIQTKPHGHGDVHGLLHRSGLAKAWQQQGLKWVCFFQVMLRWTQAAAAPQPVKWLGKA
jgi:UDP-N-acetylglucosamine pyrophosphorylase